MINIFKPKYTGKTQVQYMRDTEYFEKVYKSCTTEAHLRSMQGWLIRYCDKHCGFMPQLSFSILYGLRRELRTNIQAKAVKERTND